MANCYFKHDSWPFKNK